MGKYDCLILPTGQRLLKYLIDWFETKIFLLQLKLGRQVEKSEVYSNDLLWILTSRSVRYFCKLVDENFRKFVPYVVNKVDEKKRDPWIFGLQPNLLWTIQA